MQFPFSILTALAFLCVSTLSAQPVREVPVGRTITVNGEAEVRVVPDEAVFNFGIETSSMDIQEARVENDKRLRELLALTSRLGIAQQHVQTDYLDIEPRYEYENDEKRRKFIGYFTTRNVAITLKDLRAFEELLTGALKLGVTGVGQAQFRTSELRKHRDQARLMAVRAAKEKAIDMSKELGSTIGRPISISEASVWEDNWSMSRRGGRMMMQNAMMDAPSSEGGGSSIIAPGQIAVSARVTVIFELQ